MQPQSLEGRGRRIVADRLIAPFFQRKAQFVGVELEYPVICDGSFNMREISSSLLTYLIKNYGFTKLIEGSDGLPVRISSPDGDRVSFEMSYSTIEFSMQYDKSLTNIAERFYCLLEKVIRYLSYYGHRLTGMGTNLRMDFENILYVKDDFTRYINSFMENHTYYRKSNCLFYNMFSTQTHIEVEGKNLVEAFNLMLKLDFVRGLLFSNSLPCDRTLPPGKSYPKGTICARDFNWIYSSFPSTGCFNVEPSTTDSLIDFITELELFIDKKNGVINPIDKISISRYFQNPENPDDNFSLFRMFSNVAINHYHTLEIRGDCTQPISDAFAPSAFNIGILSDIEASSDATAEFFSKNRIKCCNSLLRIMAITGAIDEFAIIDSSELRKFLKKLYYIAYNSLKIRGFGEERFIKCLENRIEDISCPAKAMQEMLLNGTSLREIENLYGYKYWYGVR